MNKDELNLSIAIENLLVSKNMRGMRKMGNITWGCRIHYSN